MLLFFRKNLALLLLFVSFRVAAVPVLSPDGASLTGVPVPGFGAYDVFFGDGIVGEVYAGTVFDAARYGEADAVSRAIIETLIALDVRSADAINGCGITYCVLFVPNEYIGNTYYDDNYARGDYFRPHPSIWALEGRTALISDYWDTAGPDNNWTLATYVRSDVPVPAPLALVLTGLAIIGVCTRSRR